MRIKGLAASTTMIVLIIALMSLNVQAQKTKQWVEIYVTDGSLIRGYLLSQENGVYVVKSNYGKSVIQSASIEKIRFFTSPHAISQQKRELFYPRYSNFILSLGRGASGSITHGTTGGISFVIPFPQRVSRDADLYLNLSLMPEVSLSKFTNIIFGETDFLSSIALFARIKYDINEALSSHIAMGPMLNRQAKKLFPALSLLGSSDSSSYLGFGTKLSMEMFLGKHGIDFSISYYIEEGANRWDMRIGYVFRGGK